MVRASGIYPEGPGFNPQFGYIFITPSMSPLHKGPFSAMFAVAFPLCEVPVVLSQQDVVTLSSAASCTGFPLLGCKMWPPSCELHLALASLSSSARCGHPLLSRILRQLPSLHPQDAVTLSPAASCASFPLLGHKMRPPSPELHLALASLSSSARCGHPLLSRILH